MIVHITLDIYLTYDFRLYLWFWKLCFVWIMAFEMVLKMKFLTWFLGCYKQGPRGKALGGMLKTWSSQIIIMLVLIAYACFDYQYSMKDFGMYYFQKIEVSPFHKVYHMCSTSYPFMRIFLIVVVFFSCHPPRLWHFIYFF